MIEGWHWPFESGEAHWFDDLGLALCGWGQRAPEAPVLGLYLYDREHDCRTCWRLLQLLIKADEDVKQGALA